MYMHFSINITVILTSQHTLESDRLAPYQSGLSFIVKSSNVA